MANKATKSHRRKIVFKDGISELNTSYSNLFGLDVLYINSDVMPEILNTANVLKGSIYEKLNFNEIKEKLWILQN